MGRIVPDATPIVYLAKIGKLQLLRQLYEDVIIPPRISEELFTGKHPEIPVIQEAYDAGWLEERTLNQNAKKFPVQTTTRRSRPTPGREPGSSIVLYRTSSLDNRRRRQDRETHRAGLGSRSKGKSSSHPRSIRSPTGQVRRNSRPLQIASRRAIPSHRRSLRTSSTTAGEGQREKAGLKHYGKNTCPKCSVLN